MSQLEATPLISITAHWIFSLAKFLEQIEFHKEERMQLALIESMWFYTYFYTTEGKLLTVILFSFVLLHVAVDENDQENQEDKSE